MSDGLFETLNAKLRAAMPNGVGDADGLVWCYVRAGVLGMDNAQEWNYTVVPFSTDATPVPAPIFFTGASQGVLVSSAQGTITATVSATGDPANQNAEIILTLNASGITVPANVTAPRLEIVVNPGGAVVPGESGRISVIVLSLGADGAPIPNDLKVVARLPIADQAETATVTVSAQVGQKGVPVSAWLTDGPISIVSGWFGTSVGAASLPLPLINLLNGLGIPLGSISTLQPVPEVSTVDTDQPTTGTRIDLDLSSTQEWITVSRASGSTTTGSPSAWLR